MSFAPRFAHPRGPLAMFSLPRSLFLLAALSPQVCRKQPSMRSGYSQYWADSRCLRAIYFTRGRLTMTNRTNPKLSCRNWECGVLCQIPASGALHDTANQGPRLDISVFLGSIPVPMVVPGDAYGTTTSSQTSSRPQPKRPWLYQEN